ncbi:hypothetical protein BpHYR1_036394 [Brachionus plicatilis]|uniref:Uncharacterized protein n=1 Tax=Brachionus plicatilis TaxID=10195 RepID=A0A3M7SP07_BRAPC|nr:hypothetical protein BpHYR1_036394 [Brachionus plicatilis]
MEIINRVLIQHIYKTDRKLIDYFLRSKWSKCIDFSHCLTETKVFNNFMFVCSYTYRYIILSNS